MKVDALHAQLVSINRRKKALELRIEARQLKRLIALPAQAGVEDMDFLIVALIPLSSAVFRQRLKAAGFDDAGNEAGEAVEAASKPSNGIAKNGTGKKRPHFTPELKSRVKTELEAGKKTVAALAREYGPSHPTIMSWKREWGMTQPRVRN